MSFRRLTSALAICVSFTSATDSAFADCITPPFTHIWLSPFSANPSFADTPLVNSAASTSVYIWARLPQGESITALSLNIVSSTPIETFSADLDNPSLGIRDGKFATRFEHTPDATSNGRTMEVQGFTIGDRDSVGLGFGSGTEEADPFYDPGVDAWRLGSVSFTTTATDFFLQVGKNGIQGVNAEGEITPEFDVVFGHENDTPLCAVEDRGVSSDTVDARIVAGEFDAVRNTTQFGSYFQTPSAELNVSLGPRDSNEAWHVTEELRADGHLSIELDDYMDPSERGTVDRVALLSAGAISGTFDSVAIGETTLQGSSTHTSGGLFRTIEYTSDSVHLTNYFALVGDLNGDRSVGFPDFLLLSANFGEEGDWTQGEMTGDGLVGFPDFLALSQAFGSVAPSIALAEQVSVPEPLGGLAVWSFPIAFLMFSRRKRLVST